MDNVIVPAVELRAWARASLLLAQREGFPRTAKAIQAYIDDIEAHMHDGAHSFELRPILTDTNNPYACSGCGSTTGTHEPQKGH